MPRLMLPGMHALALAGAMAAAGWAWRDCVLIATSAALAYRLFLLRMDRGAPWLALTAALDTLTAGALAASAGIGLLAGVGAVWLGWWQPAAPHPALTLLLVVIAAAWCCLARGSRAGAFDELRVWVLLLSGILLAMQARRAGLDVAPCLFVLAVGLAMLWAGWHLAGATASALLRSGSEIH